MKLYLSSFRIPNVDELVKLIGKPAKETQVVVISNASDYYAERFRKLKVQDSLDYLNEIGFKPGDLDLRDYRNSEDIEKDLQGADLIWLRGGNTFMLMEAINNSGFKKTIRNLLKKGVVYGGESAGACVAGNSLRGIEYADDARFADEVWNGMKLIDNYILPHVGSPMFPESIDKARADHADDKTMIELTDQQALVVDGKTRKIVEATK